MTRSRGVEWTREHSLIALNIYFKIPFGKLHKNNKQIVEIAERMGRTPSSLAMKLVNLASLDPVLQARGISGLQKASKHDREMWQEFQVSNATLAEDSERLLEELFATGPHEQIDLMDRDTIRTIPTIRSSPQGPTEAQATAKIRRGQSFFRQAVLTAYGVRCCICGISAPELLTASHIKPWSRFPEHRLDVSNGLCLSKLHDAAFDAGLIAIDDELRIVLSKRLKARCEDESSKFNFLSYEAKPIQKPNQNAHLNLEFLAFHRKEIFIG